MKHRDGEGPRKHTCEAHAAGLGSQLRVDEAGQVVIRLPAPAVDQLRVLFHACRVRDARNVLVNVGVPRLDGRNT